ncbi:protein translocase subunit [Lunasporangiospora selenospora]|uniref:Mitochondrial import inner membrane translocase subunit n=1 Tax=Lunasporangiospora selenospora TaxID=979761 RepID=A0A9P6KCL2_9FUNG|nr:protein translocase subunit [Lunasporangiospora selenospora]
MLRIFEILTLSTHESNIMSDFGGYSGGGSMEAKKQQVMDQVRSELALANAQELINACLSKCMDRYMEAWNIVSRTYINRVQRESQNMGGAGGF